MSRRRARRLPAVALPLLLCYRESRNPLMEVEPPVSTVEPSALIPLVMSRETRDDLWMLVQAPPPTFSSAGLAALRRALRSTVVMGELLVRLSCDALALEFIRAEAPEIARLFPAVFGDVEVPRSHQLMSIAQHAIGQTVAGAQLDPDGGLRLEFESGSALVVGADGSLDWRHGG